MPRRGENIYKRKDGRWEGRLLQYDGKYQSFYGKSYQEVKEKKKVLTSKIGRPPRKKTGEPVSASAKFELWLEGRLADRLKPSTYESYYTCTTKYVIPFFLCCTKNSITADSVTEFVRSIYNNNALSDSYKNKIIRVFKVALKDMIENSEQRQEILRIVKQVKVENPTVEIFTAKERRQIEAELFLNQDSKSLGILLCFYTGIRLGELCALKWDDLDLDECLMTVARTVSRIKCFDQGDEKTKLTVGPPKSRYSNRKIPIPQFLISPLTALKNKSSCRSENNDFFFLSNSGTPIDPRTIQKQYKRILKQSGVNDRKFHAIRHTFATRALESGIDIKTLSEILGHSNVLITLKVYAHSLMEQKIEAINRLSPSHIPDTYKTLFTVTNTVVTG